MTTETTHTCSYSCERPGCIRAQRDELAARLAAETSSARGKPVPVLIVDHVGGTHEDVIRALPSGTRLYAAPLSAPVGVEAVRGAWLAAITLANNICVQESDRENDRDGDTGWINGTAECAKRIREYAHPTDAELLEMLDEAGANAAKTALSQQPAAVDEAMLERALIADAREYGASIPESRARRLLAAALATQHQEPTT